VGGWKLRVSDTVRPDAWGSRQETDPVREIRLAGHDGAFDTPDDVLLSFNRFATLLDVQTREDTVLDSAKEKIDAFFFGSSADDTAKELPGDEAGATLVADLRDSGDRPLRYHRITRDRFRLAADGPDATAFTADDVILAATVVRADPDEAARLKSKPLTWWEKRVIELKGEDGRREVEAGRGQAPRTKIDREITVGGLVTLEGAAYYWFWTACMAAAAVAFIPIAVFFRGRPHLQDEPAAT
jgi:POT family proton-dependent oligopeptide transporter